MTFEQNLETIRSVAKLEGWDESRLDTHLQHYQAGNKDVQEALKLFYSKPVADAAEYLRIHGKRPQIFWDQCRVTNDTSMREYVDIRRLAKSIRTEIFNQAKGPRKNEGN